MEFRGKIISALEIKEGTSSRGSWKSQDYVIEEENDAYSHKIAFTVFGEDRINRFKLAVGQHVIIQVDFDAREYNGRWYNSIRAYDVRQIEAPTEPQQQPSQPSKQAQPIIASNAKLRTAEDVKADEKRLENSENDLPF